MHKYPSKLILILNSLKLCCSHFSSFLLFFNYLDFVSLRFYPSKQLVKEIKEDNCGIPQKTTKNYVLLLTCGPHNRVFESHI